MTNLGVWIFSVVMLAVAWKNRAKFYRARNGLIGGGLLGTVSLWILLLDSVEMHRMLYIRIHMGQEWFKVWEFVIRGGEALLLLLCCMLSLWRIGLLLLNTRLRIRRRFLAAVWISVA